MRQSELIQAILSSEQGQLILDKISPIYDDSYSALWLLQSIGVQLDEVASIAERLMKQIVPQTATAEYIRYWEQEYGIGLNTALSFAERKAKLLATIKTRAPMNPKKLEEIITSVCGLNCRIEENVEWNKFDVYIETLTAIDTTLVCNEINKAKPAHLIYDIKYELGVEGVLYPAIILQVAKTITLRQVN